jgi:curved DNA-binding protein CbpA
MRMQRNFYEVLGVQRNATQQEIKEKYLNLARQYHPDRAKDKEIADRLFVQINRAYTTLSNRTKREQYDATLGSVLASPSQQASRQTMSQPVPAPAPAPPTQQQIREWFDQAARLQMKGDLTQGLELCYKVINADPNFFAALLLTGDLLAQTRKESEALAMYERAAKIQPTNRLLREKISRLSTLMARRTTNPGLGARPSAENISPPPPSAAPAQRPEPKPAPTPEPSTGKSFLDRLMNRK